MLFSAGPSRHWCSLPLLPPKPCLYPVPEVPTWVSLCILASDFFAPGDLYHHSALAIHAQPGPGSSIPISSSSSDHSLSSFQLPSPHIIKFVRDFQGSASSKPTVHLPAYPSSSWGPWTTLSAAPSIFTIHTHSVCHLAASQGWGKAALHLLHPPPQPPDCILTMEWVVWDINYPNKAVKSVGKGRGKGKTQVIKFKFLFVLKVNSSGDSNEQPELRSRWRRPDTYWTWPCSFLSGPRQLRAWHITGHIIIF